MNIFKVIIAGSRNYSDYDTLKRMCDSALANNLGQPDVKVVIVSGHAPGADSLGERYAKERGLDVEIYPADWAKNGRAAGPIRNKKMAEIADALIAFPKAGDKNRGTQNMVDTAEQMGLQIITVDGFFSTKIK